MDLYEDIIIESMKIYGQDVYYLPRTIVNEDNILGDDVASSFDASYKIEMYIEIRDEATFIVARRRWKNTVRRAANAIQGDRPTEGDLIYLPLSKSLFQINHVEHEQPFYAIENLPTFKLRCQLFEYVGEDLDTGIDTIDNIEKDYAYSYNLRLKLPKKATGTASIS